MPSKGPRSGCRCPPADFFVHPTIEGDPDMSRLFQLAAAAMLLLSIVAAPTVASAQAKTCRMEQQCHWVNFKKICTYVKVCR